MKNHSPAFQAPLSEPSPADAPAGLRLAVLPGPYAICRMNPRARIPRWVHHSPFYSVSRSPEELSILSLQEHVPNGVKCEAGWRGLQVLGTLDLSLIGVLESLARPLAEADVEILTVSTFDTDYVFVREAKLEKAVRALEAAGHRFEDPAAETPDETADEIPAETRAVLPDLADERTPGRPDTA
ncbi:MAG: ACT domain-containing protein, partial [Holophagales bacterium]|nr:ACT domain-containing protein [Holophagales bacterium]